ncbi:MAG: DUF1273 family protein [Clostridia bacterium]|nr:DUF1273 family protein [Clostridia bacterium]
MIEKKCCFIGHRNTPKTEKLQERVKSLVKELIEKENVRTFLFGSKSAFDDLCFDIVTELKAEYPDIRLVYARNMYPVLSDYYEEYLLEFYDETYFPKRIENAGRASYVERNQEMIDASDFCVFYYDENYRPIERAKGFGGIPRSGTAVAFSYAERKSKRGAPLTVINLYKT